MYGVGPKGIDGLSDSTGVNGPYNGQPYPAGEQPSFSYNVFQAELQSANELVFGDDPPDPPGAYRYLRLTNIRVDARKGV